MKNKKHNIKENMLLKYRLSNLQSEPKNVYKMKKVVLKNLAEGIV